MSPQKKARPHQKPSVYANFKKGKRKSEKEQERERERVRERKTDF
jgi:hypothetical protein